MVGVVLILLVMFLIGPIVIFVGGAIFSALIGWLLSPDDAAEEVEAAAA